MKTKIRRKRFALLAAVILAGGVIPLLTSCGGGKTTTVHTQNASVGQQLQDLEKAHREGMITDKEYEKLKKAIIKNND